MDVKVHVGVKAQVIAEHDPKTAIEESTQLVARGHCINRVSSFIKIVQTGRHGIEWSN